MRVRALSDHDLTQMVIAGIVEWMLDEGQVDPGAQWRVAAKEIVKRHRRRLPTCVCESCWHPPAEEGS